jgi:hypothetical protein
MQAGMTGPGAQVMPAQSRMAGSMAPMGDPSRSNALAALTANIQARGQAMPGWQPGQNAPNWYARQMMAGNDPFGQMRAQPQVQPVQSLPVANRAAGY